VTTADRGYLTLAARQPRFLEMAVDMALSLREHTALPIALAADEAMATLAQTRYSGVFDVVTLVPPRFREGRALKYGTAEASPFEETTFVDADCFVLAPLDGLFDVLTEHDVAMTGEHLTPAEKRIHHGFSTTWLIRRFDLDTYLKTNSGLFCFRRSAAIDIMEECRACYVDEVLDQLRWRVLLGKWLGDELAFGIVGGRRQLGTLPTPHAMYWPEEFSALDIERPTKPLLHMLWPPEPDTLEALLRAASARRAASGVPDEAGGTHWREEVRKLGRLARRRRVFGLVGWH
jgi:hypothetical protein